MARPSEFSEEIATTICRRIANGESLRRICNEDEMPGRQTVLDWLNDPERESFRAKYARAREDQQDFHAEEILEIADDGKNDWMARQQGEDTVEVANHEHIQRSKLRVDARKWLMSKLAPKKYGEKLDHEHSGEVKLEVEWLPPAG